jgi:hypothetical protein
MNQANVVKKDQIRNILLLKISFSNKGVEKLDIGQNFSIQYPIYYTFRLLSIGSNIASKNLNSIIASVHK